MGYRHDGAELPDTTDVFVTGETVKGPECLPQDWDSLYVATLESIRNPIGMEPLASYAGPGKKVVIVIPDIVKGGTQPTAHRKVAIRACLDELEGHDVVIDCIAKNFETLEPGSSFRLLRQYLVERYGREEAARRIVFTGTIGSPLEELCCAEGYLSCPSPLTWEVVIPHLPRCTCCPWRLRAWTFARSLLAPAPWSDAFVRRQ